MAFKQSLLYCKYCCISSLKFSNDVANRCDNDDIATDDFNVLRTAKWICCSCELLIPNLALSDINFIHEGVIEWNRIISNNLLAAVGVDTNACKYCNALCASVDAPICAFTCCFNAADNNSLLLVGNG